MGLLIAQQTPGAGLQQTIDSLARTPLSQIVVLAAACSLLRILLFFHLRGARRGGRRLAWILNEAMDAVVYAGVFVFMLIRPFAIQAFLIPSGSMLQTLWVNDFIVANKAVYRYSDPAVGDIVVFKPPGRALNPGGPESDFIKRCVGTPGDLVEVRGGKLFRNGKQIDEPYLTDSPGENADGNGHALATGASVRMTFDWKLIRYQGSRKDLYGQYIPVQIDRRLPPDEPTCNYEHGGICRPFAVGVGHPDGTNSTWVNADEWTPRDLLKPEDWRFEKELQSASPVAVPKGFVLMMGDNRNFSYDGRAWGLVPREDVIGRSEVIWLPVGRWRITR